MATRYPLSNGLEVLSILAADGAGSARCSERGAAVACEVAQRQIERWAATTPDCLPGPELLQEWVCAARTALAELSAVENADIRDFACTLLIAVVAPVGAAYAQIGDGAIVIDQGAGLEVAFWPELGEYANTTRFITDTDALEHLQVQCSAIGPDEIAVLTDGLQRLALDFRSATVHVPFFSPMLAVLRRQCADECTELQRHLATFLDSAKVNSRTDDDKTLVLATRRSAAG